MKNTKSRKKMLMSSVAMLLVALIALGTATFAWFAANPNAYAKGLSLKTTASTGLVVMSDSVKGLTLESSDTREKWSHYTTLNAVSTDGTDVDAASEANYDFNSSATPVNLTPVSQDQSTPANFWTATAEKSNAFGANTTGASAVTSGFYKEKIYCRLSDGSNGLESVGKKVQLTGVTITKATNATMENCIRVAITGPTGTDGAEKLLGTYAIATNTNNGVLNTASATTKTGEFVPGLAATATNLSVDTGLAVTKDASDNLTGLTASATDYSQYITVYVWLDGQDTDCTSDNVGTVNATQIIESVQVDLKLV